MTVTLRKVAGISVPVAARFLAAQPFPPSSGRSLVMGGALVVETIRAVSTVDRQTLNQAFREHGEIGEALSALWPEPAAGVERLTLAEVQAGFGEIAATGNQDAKRQLLTGLLRRTSPREAVYLVKIILGDMRTGVSEGVIEMALAEAFNVKLAEVRRARLLVGDLDAVAELAYGGRLGQAAFRPFVPLGYMLAQPVMTAAYLGLAEFKPGSLQGPSAAPSLYIAADEPSPRSDVARLKELAPGLLYGQTVGSGHFCQLEVPGQVNAMIDRFVQLLPQRDSPA